MFLKIISLGLIFLVDFSTGNCGICQENRVACHSESTFSICVEGKPTYNLIQCPRARICTSDPSVCMRKINDKLRPSCLSEKLETFHIENFDEMLDSENYSPIAILSTSCSCESTVDEDLKSTTSSPIAEDSISPPSSDTTLINEESSSTDDSTYGTTTSDEETSGTEESLPTDEPISSSTDSTLSDEETTFTPEQISSSTQISESSTASDFPRDASKFCSEIQEVGTFEAEGDTTCKRYYVCTTANSGFNGYEFNCGVYYFNPEISLCQNEKPKEC